MITAGEDEYIWVWDSSFKKLCHFNIRESGLADISQDVSDSKSNIPRGTFLFRALISSILKRTAFLTRKCS